jgi:long-chain fatty acid transport protein
MRMRRDSLYLLLALGLVQEVDATGFFVNQQSVRGLGRVNAGVAAAADDPSTVFFNPAGLPFLWEGTRSADNLASAGVQVIIPGARLEDRGSVAAAPGTLGNFVPVGGPGAKDPADPTPIPNFHYARRLGNGWALGLGLGAPFGLSSTYAPGWFGRYDALESSLETVNLGGVVARRISRTLTIGGGIDAQHARSKLTTALPNPLAPGGPTPQTDARNTARGTAWTAGFNAGAMWMPDDATRIGLHFRSGMNHRIEGTSTTSGFTGPLAPANGETAAVARLRLPAMAGLGIVRTVAPGARLYAQADWYGWSRLREIRIAFDNGTPDAVRTTNYRDAWAASVGMDLDVSGDLTLRAGLRFDQTPTRDGFRDTTFPDAERLWIGAGLTWRVSPALTVDLAAKHVDFRRAEVDVVRTFYDGTPLASAVRVRGSVDSRITTVALNATFSF